ncbi:hypothetical protein FB45DRAFT_1006664 [Roridomyces roridus]|uniref:Transmembrane protein n=1 Tax=Roridomyces roridus TaxID=1738132 RepID=A0AAD7BI49_9AGAR|nr:hypothetical protein FB45DRAFT_1006664 [Roridomyces roridus]
MSLWNFTVNDTSPILSYHPYADGSSAQNGWQLFYTSSGFNTQTGESGQGDSFHVTSLSGGQVTLGFHGNAVYLYGSSNASYDITLDGTVHSFSPTSGLLYSNTALTEDDHSVTLTAKPSNSSQVLQFGSAIVTDSTTSSPTPKIVDNADSALEYYGSWTTSTAQGVPNSSVSLPFHQTLSVGSGFTMQLPVSTVAVALYASTNFGHGLYSVAIDDKAPQTFNGSTNWLVGDTLIYFEAGMNGNTTHKLGGAKFTLSRVVAYQLDDVSAPPTSNPPAHSKSKTKVNVGAIIGPIVGVVLLLLLIWWLYTQVARMRRRVSGDAETQRVDPLPLDLPRAGLVFSTPSQASEVPSTAAASSLTVSTAAGATITSPRRGRIGKLSAPNLNAPPPPTQSQSQSQSGAESTTTQASSPTAGLPPGVDMDRIIELIAQRIDRREPARDQEDSELVPPPEYRAP